MKEKELTAAESLKLIERTIEQSRRDVATASAQPLFQLLRYDARKQQ